MFNRRSRDRATSHASEARTEEKANAVSSPFQVESNGSDAGWQVELASNVSPPRRKGVAG